MDGARPAVVTGNGFLRYKKKADACVGSRSLAALVVGGALVLTFLSVCLSVGAASSPRIST